MPTRKSLVTQAAGRGVPAPAARVVAAKSATKPVPVVAAQIPAKPSPGSSDKPKKPRAAGLTPEAKTSRAPGPKKAGKPSKSRQKPVRDSFTMPEADFALIAVLKERTMSAGRETKKSELLRAGLHALAALPSQALVTALNRLERVKVGRPKAAR